MNRTRTLGIATVAALALIAALLPRADVAPATPALRHAAAPRTDAVSMRASAPAQRRAAQPGERRDFAAILDDLVDVGVRVNLALEDERNREASRLGARAQALVAELERTVDGVAEHALTALDDLLAEDTSLTAEVRRGVCLRLIQAGLESRGRAVAASGARHALDALVSGMLVVLPRDERSARDLGSLLRDRPYLGLSHEDDILTLVEIAADRPFLVPTAATLLLTLWHNLEREGARTSGELATLALLFKDDANPSRRLAAMRELMTIGAGRFRDLVVRETLERRDRAMARAIGAAAAQDLAPGIALAVLEDLLEVGGTDLMSAFLALAQRDDTLLRRRYEQVLGENRDPALRAELVSGCGFAGMGGTDTAELALSLDPDPEVRARAMFVLTARGAPEVARNTLSRALDDPRVTADPKRLGQVIAALRNLLGRCSPDVIAGLGQRIRQHELLGEDRATLDKLIARAVPGGR